jgi:hypothetical protein
VGREKAIHPELFAAILMKNRKKADKKVAAGCGLGALQDVHAMKIEPNLTLVKGQETACTNPRKTSRVARQTDSSGIELLISQENQQAHRLDPSSLTEARSLLLDVTWRLSGNPADSLAEVHLLESPCLVRLR